MAKLFGSRTAGAGGNTVNAAAGFYSEGAVSLSQMLMVRPKMQSVPGFPASRYVENIGVRPDIEYDFQTRENLISVRCLSRIPLACFKKLLVQQQQRCWPIFWLAKSRNPG